MTQKFEQGFTSKLEGRKQVKYVKNNLATITEKSD